MTQPFPIQIDDQTILAEKDQTILEAANKAGVYIPHLCSYNGLPPMGACRLCIVEVVGMRGYPTACSTPAIPGMSIQTRTQKLQELRGRVLELILSEHPSNCILCDESKECSLYMATLKKGEAVTGCRSCPSDGNCELQQVIEYIGVSDLSLPNFYRGVAVERYDPFYNRDYNLCILCGRCVQVCHEIRHADVLAFTSRGRNTIISPAFHRTHLDAGCEFCGDCVSVCPTGCLVEKTRRYTGSVENEVITTCPYCSLGCEIVLQTSKNQVIRSLPSQSDSGERNELCVLGRFGVYETVNHRTRVKQPLQMSDSYSKPVSWDDALSVMAAKVASCAPNDFIMLISPDCTSEDLAAASQFCRDVIHTDQIFAPTHSAYSSLLDLPRSYRSSLSDLHNLSTNDLILGIGLDQRYFQSNISLEIKNAVLRGCPLILIQPGHTHLDRFASQVIPAQPEKYQQILKFIKTFSINNLNKTDPQYDNPEINHLVASIRQANRVVLVMGDLYLETQANQDVCEWIQAIYPNKDIKLLCVPHPANLVAAHTLGIDRYLQEIPLEAAPYKFAYLIGVQPPSEFRLADFLVYQNFVHPTTTHHCDLILPTPAFSEENGTFLSYDSSVRRVHTAIHPPSGPLPSWKILSLLARRMGNHDFVMNFDQNQENIDVNFLKSFGLFNNKQPSTVQRNSGLEKLASPVFRGFPVSTWVEGLQDLPPLTHYSEPSR